MKKLMLVVALSGAGAWAGGHPAVECREDAKKFIAICEKACDQRIKKKNPKAMPTCLKTCAEQSAEMEKDCVHGK